MKWGAKARFNDLEPVIKELNPSSIEFHLTDNDVRHGHICHFQYPVTYSVHLPEYWEQQLIDPCNQDLLKDNLTIYKTCIEKSLSLKDRFIQDSKLKVVMHPGAATVDPLDDDYLLTFKKDSLYKRLKSFVDCLEMFPAFKDNIEVLVENMPPLPWFYGGQYYSNIFCNPLEIKAFCDKYERNICLDISHLGLYCNQKNLDLIESIKILKPYTKQIHIADASGTDGEGVQIGEGNIDFKAVMKEIENLDIAIIPETMWGHKENFSGFKKTMTICNKIRGTYYGINECAV